MTSETPGVRDCAASADTKPGAEEEHWYALVTTPRFERAAEATLHREGYEVLAPMQKCGTGKRCVTGRPVFPGYVFCRFRYEDRFSILATPGVMRIAGRKRIADSEINSLRVAVGLELALHSFPYLRAGQRIRIREGPLAGLEGIVITFRQVLRVVLSVELIKQSVLLETSLDQVLVEGIVELEDPELLGRRGL